MQNHPFPVLLFGFVLGLKHALDPDHLIAVTTLVTEHKNVFKSALVGAFWGIGHTTVLFLVGLLVLVLNISIPERVSLFFEMVVGIMLVLLGIRAIRLSHRIHTHTHAHGGHDHTHLHEHPESHTHSTFSQKRSFFVGLVHGMAGSGALMLLVLSTIKGLLEGVYYILIFGVGSIIGMTIMSFIIGLPVIFSTTYFVRFERAIRMIAGMLSIAFGAYIVYDIGIINHLFEIR